MRDRHTVMPSLQAQVQKQAQICNKDMSKSVCLMKDNMTSTMLFARFKKYNASIDLQTASPCHCSSYLLLIL